MKRGLLYARRAASATHRVRRPSVAASAFSGQSELPKYRERRAGKLRMLAVTGENRIRRLPTFRRLLKAASLPMTPYVLAGSSLQGTRRAASARLIMARARSTTRTGSGRLSKKKKTRRAQHEPYGMCDLSISRP